MSLLSGLLAGAASGTANSWESRKAELKIEAANKFRRETDRIVAQGEKDRIAAQLKADKDLDKYRREQSRLNAGPPNQNPEYIAAMIKISEEQLENPTDDDGKPRDYEAYRARVSGYFGVDYKRKNIEDPAIIEAARRKAEAERVAEAKRVQDEKDETDAQLKADNEQIRLNELNKLTTGDVTGRVGKGLLKKAAIAGEYVADAGEYVADAAKTIGGSIADAGRYVVESSAGMARADLITRWDNGQKTIQTAKAIIEQNQIDSNSVSKKDSQLAMAIMARAPLEDRLPQPLLESATEQSMDEDTTTPLDTVKATEKTSNYDDNGDHVVSQFVIGQENFSAEAYPDGSGWAIGYGTNNKNVKEGQTITKKEAYRLMQKDLKNAQDYVDELVNVPLTANQNKAIVSLMYNTGYRNIEKSDALLALNAGDYEMFAELAFGDDGFVYTMVDGKMQRNQGLVNRRKQERLLFNGNNMN